MKIQSTLLILALAGMSAACHSSAAKSEAVRGVPVRTARVEQRDIEDVVVVAGTLRPRAQVQVVAEVSARLTKVLHDEGARVAAGETIATLDDTDYRLGLDRAKAALAVAEANQAHATVEKERADNLLKTGGITDKDHLAAQVGLRVAEAARAQASAEVAIAQQQLARCTLKAPFAGRIAKRFVDAGAQLAPGAPVFTMVDDSLFEFRGPLPSAEFGRVRVGATVALAVDALPDLKAQGRVARVAPLIDERTRSCEVSIEIPGDKELVGGLFARASVRVGVVKAAVVVPPSALARDGSHPDQAETFVVASGKAERRTVRLGVERADVIQVREGLAPGDEVVLDPPSSLGTGMPVEVQNGKR